MTLLQPFERFEQKYLDRLLQMKRIYLVTQTYSRARPRMLNGEQKDFPILLTDYEDHGGALIHYNAVRKNDKYGYLLDLTKPAHLDKLTEMLAGDKYLLYWCVVKSLDALKLRLKTKYKDQVRRFIEGNTDWRIKGSDSVKTTLELSFGELFIIIRWSNRSLRVKFEDVERYLNFTYGSVFA